MNVSLITSIDALLPQTQCGQCGYAGCKPYAIAISTQDASINQCPPGGDAVIHQLAQLLNVPRLPLNPLHGEHKPKLLAVIDESACIGCTLCIAACPVDAIIGASKLMHSVIAAECTGCELCIAPCPVDCIRLQPAAETLTAMDTLAPQDRHAANIARQRHEHRLWRQTQQKYAQQQRRQSRQAPPSSDVTDNDDHEASRKSLSSADIKKATMRAAMAKAVNVHSATLPNQAHPASSLMTDAAKILGEE